jgi:hypothetical protein
MNEEITIKINETFDAVLLEECDTIWKSNIKNKLNVSTNYYNLSIDDREKILTLINDWSKEELKKVSKIRKNNRPSID